MLEWGVLLEDEPEVVTQYPSFQAAVAAAEKWNEATRVGFAPRAVAVSRWCSSWEVM